MDSGYARHKKPPYTHLLSSISCRSYARALLSNYSALLSKGIKSYSFGGKSYSLSYNTEVDRETPWYKLATNM